MFGEEKAKQKVDNFWREYEEKTGEQVLAKTLGQYLSGWEDFDRQREAPLWGLVIATSGGLRFHHFPQQNWLGAILRIGTLAGEAKEKTFFIPRARIAGAEIRTETNWLKKIFSSSLPLLIVQYRAEDDGDLRQLSLQLEHGSEGIVENITRVVR